MISRRFTCTGATRCGTGRGAVNAATPATPTKRAAKTFILLLRIRGGRVLLNSMLAAHRSRDLQRTEG